MGEVPPAGGASGDSRGAGGGLPFPFPSCCVDPRGFLVPVLNGENSGLGVG